MLLFSCCFTFQTLGLVRWILIKLDIQVQHYWLRPWNERDCQPHFSLTKPTVLKRKTTDKPANGIIWALRAEETFLLFLHINPFSPKLKKYILPAFLKRNVLVRQWGFCGIIIFHLRKLWKAKFLILCDVILLVRLQGKFDIDHSQEWKG